MRYEIKTPFGKITVSVTCEFKTRENYRSYYSHFDRNWERWVVARSTVEEPIKANRTLVKLAAYWYCTQNSSDNPYHLLRSYGSGSMSKIENGQVLRGDVPEGCRNKINEWLNAFIPAWLQANPGIWVDAEKEGRLNDAKRCQKDIEALHKKIAELERTIATREDEANAYEKQREYRLFPVQNVPVTAGTLEAA